MRNPHRTRKSFTQASKFLAGLMTMEPRKKVKRSMMIVSQGRLQRVDVIVHPVEQYNLRHRPEDRPDLFVLDEAHHVVDKRT